MASRTLRDYLMISARGIAMGAADIVPGVSGGTIAFITGIYEELLETLSGFNLKLLSTLRNEGMVAAWKAMNGNFLVALFTGVLISIFSLAKLISFLLHSFPHLLWAFFFGLVLASIFYVGKQVERWHVRAFVGLILGAVFAYWITILPPPPASPDGLASWYIFLCGMIAICAMILPGISGSFILLILGAYSTVINAIKEMEITLLGLFTLGCILGLFSFSRFLNWLFKKSRNTTIAILTGFLIGSLNKIWPWKVDQGEALFTHSDGTEEFHQINVLPSGFESDPQIGLAILWAVIGFALIFVMERIALKVSK